MHKPKIQPLIPGILGIFQIISLLFHTHRIPFPSPTPILQNVIYFSPSEYPYHGDVDSYEDGIAVVVERCVAGDVDVGSYDISELDGDVID